MASLVDVNILLAAAWDTHLDHDAIRPWMMSEQDTYTCPIVELGFVRVSLTPAYGASMESALGFLTGLKKLNHINRIDDNVSIDEMSVVDSYRDTTDAYLVFLASENGMRMATLDQKLLKKPWAKGIAFCPVDSDHGV